MVVFIEMVILNIGKYDEKKEDFGQIWSWSEQRFFFKLWGLNEIGDRMNFFESKIIEFF